MLCPHSLRPKIKPIVYNSPLGVTTLCVVNTCSFIDYNFSVVTHPDKDYDNLTIAGDFGFQVDRTWIGWITSPHRRIGHSCKLLDQSG